MAKSHPSDEKLTRWVEGRSTPITNTHIEHCPQCLQRLEDQTALEEDLRQRLADDLAPSRTVSQRLQERLERALADRETMSMLTDLMNNGLRTSHVLLEGDHRDKDDLDG